jgi:hypothetical protein
MTMIIAISRKSHAEFLAGQEHIASIDNEFPPQTTVN